MSLAKAKLTNLYTNEELHCLFNPTEYTLAKSNSWKVKEVIGKNVPETTFSGGNPTTLTIQLFFDVLEDDGATVRDHVDKLWRLALIDEDKKHPKSHRSRPPLCRFEWGQNWHFQAVVTSLSVRYTLFREDGTPVRATADASFQEAIDETDQPGTNPTSHAEPGYKRRELQLRDSLALISYEEYGTPNLWRLIADANHLTDPLRLRAGQIISIPPRS